MASLFIGRFQPFHLGHLDAIHQALEKNNILYIGIGSANENYLPQNPFTTGERIQMIKAALDEAGIRPEKYMIIPIPNINNYELWPSHVEQYLPPFETLYTCSEIVKTLFENENSKRKHPWKIVTLKKRKNISSTIVRAAMLKNSAWEKKVPPAVTKLLKTWQAETRLKAVQEGKK